MDIRLFSKLLAVGVAAALLAFAFFGADLLFLAKGLALAVGLSLLAAIFYPQVRGVRSGDRVMIVGNSAFPGFLGMGRAGFAMNSGTLKKEIRVRMDDGQEAIGVLESYAGAISPPRVRVIYEEKIIER